MVVVGTAVVVLVVVPIAVVMGFVVMVVVMMMVVVVMVVMMMILIVIAIVGVLPIAQDEHWLQLPLAGIRTGKPSRGIRVNGEANARGERKRCTAR